MKDSAVLEVKRSNLEDYLGDPLVVENVFSIDGEKSSEDISAISSSKIQMSYIELDTGRNYWTDFEKSELLKHFSFNGCLRINCQHIRIWTLNNCRWIEFLAL